jgi:hypothetical protein
MCRKGGICCAVAIRTNAHVPFQHTSTSLRAIQHFVPTRKGGEAPRTSSIEWQLAEQVRKDAKRVRASLLRQSCDALPRDHKC